MKIDVIKKLLLFTGASVQTYAAKLETTPMARVASLLTEMKSRIEADGKVEQMSYDKYACWCEDTLGKKAKDISDGKTEFQDLEVLIEKLEGDIGAHKQEIKQLEKDITGNKESQSEASSIREKDTAAYEEGKVESEQCIGAMEAAIKVLNGAGTSKGFLETMKEAQLLSVAAEVRGVMRNSAFEKKVSSGDLDLVRQFVANPKDFVGARAGAVSAAQTSNNPFGDYAPQSTQIQGILKGMYETFASDLEKDNVAESEAQKSHEALMATKQQELRTLQTTITQQQLDKATKSQNKAESNQRRDDLKVQIAADEKLFDELKGGCKEKAAEWAERTRLRTEELAGVGQAIGILTDEESQRVFVNSTTTFVQMAAISIHSDRHIDAYAKVAELAQKFHSYGLAQLAVQLKSGGHFDKVIASVDQMIAVLRKEDQDDIAHRDRCQRAEGKNNNDVEDLSHAITKAGAAEGVLQGEQGKLQGEVNSLLGDIDRTKQEIQAALDMRNEAVGEFRQALQDDTDAIALLEQAIGHLKRFYTANKIPLGLISKAKKSSPEYSVDPNKPPETSWSGAYGGHNTETHGVTAILEMIKEDIIKEVADLRKDDARGQKQFEKERGAMEETLDSQTNLKLATEKELLSVEKQLLDVQTEAAAKGKDLLAENALTQSLIADCSWVASHFDSRRDKRKAEIQGLIDAKGFLGGVDSGI